MKTKENIFIKIKNSNSKNWWIYAFILGALLYYMFMSVSGIVYGRYIFVEGDAFSGYFPCESELRRDILNGDNIFYSWSVNMGTNNIANVTCYGQLFGITNILNLIFNFTDMTIPAFIALLLRAGLCAMCFQIYSVRYLNSNKLISLLISVGYAMCSYQIYMNIINYFFADALWLVPLLAYFIRRFLEDGNWIPLTLCYTYIFINSVYMGYMVGLFTGLYFICYLIIEKKDVKDKLKCFFRFAYSVLLSVGIFAFLLIPTVYYVFTHEADDADMFDGIGINLMDVYNQLFIGANSGRVSYFPYIYIGILPLLIFPLYFFNKKINLKSKIVNTILLVFMLVSCLVDGLYMMWHAFNIPDSWHYRFTFLISFLLCSIVCEELNYIKEIKVSYLLIMIIINSGIYIGEMFLQKKYPAEYQSNDWLFLIINIVFMLSTTLIIYAYNNIYQSIRYKKVVILIMILCISFELILNGYSSMYRGYNMKPSMKTNKYYQWLDCTKEVVDELNSKETSGEFFRVNNLGEINGNADSFWGYNGLSDFVSIENVTLRKALRKLGIYTSFKCIYPYGNTDFTDMLLGVKYNISHFIYNEYSPYSNPINTLENKDYYIGLGFLVDDKTKEYKSMGDSPYENINILSKYMSGVDIDLYEAIDNELIKFEENGISLKDGSQKNIKLLEKTAGENEVGKLTVIAPKDEREADITFSYGDYSGYYIYSPYLLGGIENLYESVARLTSCYIRPMTESEEGYCTVIAMEDEQANVTDAYWILPDIYAAYYNKENISKVYDALKDNRLEIVDYHNGYVHGKISSTEDRNLLFTSIPNQEGWKVYVNGTERNIIPLIEDAFIGIELDEGENDIVFEFEVPYLKIGTYITIASLLLFAVSAVLNISNRKKNKITQNIVSTENDASITEAETTENETTKIEVTEIEVTEIEATEMESTKTELIMENKDVTEIEED